MEDWKQVIIKARCKGEEPGAGIIAVCADLLRRAGYNVEGEIPEVEIDWALAIEEKEPGALNDE